MEQLTQGTQTRPGRRRGFIILAIVILALAAFFMRNTILNAYFSTAQRLTLPHYGSAEVISHAEFEGIQPDSRIVKTREFDSVPGLNAYVEDNMGEDQFGDNALIIDVPAKKYYIFDTLDASLGVFVLWAFPFSLAGEPEYMVSSVEASDGFPLLSKQWESTGGMACFSCGCSCYMEKQLKIANGELYVNVSGKDFAIRPERQGIYQYNTGKGKWVKLTPKLEGDFKITNSGCAVAYSVQSSFYKLETCAP